MTLAAGTAVVSLLSLAASLGSWVTTSTVGRGFIRVAMGLRAARTTSSSPVVMPPSSPPARLVFR